MRDCRRRGMQAPMPAVGDGALGCWRAVRDVFPAAAEQRCRWHKIGDVVAALPKSVHPAAKRALAEIYATEDKTHASGAAKAFAIEFGTKMSQVAARSATTWMCCWRSTTSPPSTGSTYGPPTRSSRPSRTCGQPRQTVVRCRAPGCR